jgi:glycosyltransferase involved in cell wall biosynthesis
MNKLSVVLATHNEEKNLAGCLGSVKEIADEIVVVDGLSTDNTVEIAGNFKAKVIVKENPSMFHINKQYALENSTSEWILQLDADERVSPELGKEIQKVVKMTDDEMAKYQKTIREIKLFKRHERLLGINTDNKPGPYSGFFIPRKNYFLGKFLKYGGVYPDGVIRLVKKGRAYFPCKSVHEQIKVEGAVGWLQNPLLHFDSPTLGKFLERNQRYIDLLARDYAKDKLSKSITVFVDYVFIKPIFWMGLTLFRHKGIFDGWRGVVFSFFSALRFPRSYLKYLFSGSS